MSAPWAARFLPVVVFFIGRTLLVAKALEELAEFEETACLRGALRAGLGNCTLKGGYLPSRAQRAPREGAVTLPNFASPCLAFNVTGLLREGGLRHNSWGGAPGPAPFSKSQVPGGPPHNKCRVPSAGKTSDIML